MSRSDGDKAAYWGAVALQNALEEALQNAKTAVMALTTDVVTDELRADAKEAVKRIKVSPIYANIDAIKENLS